MRSIFIEIRTTEFYFFLHTVHAKVQWEKILTN